MKKFKGPPKRRSNKNKVRAKKKDPILNLERLLFEEGILTEDRKESVYREMDKTIAEAQEYAENSPYPRPEEALEYVYC